MKTQFRVVSVTQTETSEIIKLSTPKESVKGAAVEVQQGAVFNLTLKDRAMFGRYRPGEILEAQFLQLLAKS